MTKIEWQKTIEIREEMLEKNVHGYTMEPWKYSREPFHVIDNIYYVGTQYVSCYLIDTGEGLIMIDSGFYQTAYQVINNIYKLGFNPKDIKKLLLTHGHFDHCGGAAAIRDVSGCEIYLSSDDMFFLTERRDLIFHESEVPEFPVDNFYNDNEPIVLGNTVIRTIASPGHTPGTTSFFYNIRHEGRELVGATHGGIGLNGISRMELERNHLPLDLQNRYIESLKKLLTVHVDVTLPSHNKHCPSFFASADLNCRPESFIDDTKWPEMIKTMLAQVEDMKASGI